MSPADDTSMALEAAEAALARGDADLAGRQLTRALQSRPAAPELRARLGKLLRLAGRPEEAESELRGVLEDNPGHADAAYSLAFLLRDQGRRQEAASVIAGLGAVTSALEDLVGAAGFLWDLGAYAETAGLLERAVARSPEDARARFLLGRAREALGEFEAALEAYRGALDRKRDLPGAWLRLTRLGRVTDIEGPDVARLESAVEDPDLSRESRACAGFALGKALDDLDRYPEAFERFVQANADWPHRGRWSKSAWRRQIDETIRAFPAVRAARAGADGDPRPVFVVGMLRSGTTLLERLLAGHPAIEGRGELNWIREIANRLPEPGWPRAWPGLGQADRERLANLYRVHASPAAAGCRAFVDKNPLNFRFLGLIAELFPAAVIVHMRRDPRDVGLSLFQQAFEDTENAYAYDLDEIVDFHHGYERLMGHWESVLGPRLLGVRYEDLVADPARSLAPVLDALGLSAPGKTASGEPTPGSAGGIRTASAWQARQPVHRESVARWRHYRDLAPAFFQALAPR